MLSETELLHQSSIDEQNAQCFLRITNWIIGHPLPALLILLVGIILISIIVPFIIKKLRKLGITKTGNLEYTPGEQLPNEISTSEIPYKRISIMPAPNPDPNSPTKTLPQELEQLILQIENNQHGDRTRCCICCKDQIHAKELGILFYHRIKESSAIDHYGWIYYKQHNDETLNVQNCFFYSLRIFNAINDRENRFIRQIDFLSKENLHSLLVVHMQQAPDEADERFEQLNALSGLSIVLFSDKEIPGFQTYSIKAKGGRTR